MQPDAHNGVVAQQLGDGLVLQHTTTADIEARLAASVAVAHTGSLRLNLFRAGVVLAFADGQVRGVKPWERPEPRAGDVSFPEACFTQLLCGHRSLGELLAADADCAVASEEAEVLLGVLFPRRASLHWITG